MKTLTLLFVNILFTSILMAQDKGNLTVTFNEDAVSKGDIYIGVYQKDNFMAKPTVGDVLKADAGTNQITFEGLAHGEYAVSVYQDVNGNQQFDMDDYGRPAEPWVMSGNVNPNQMPIFEDAKIEFSSTEKTVSLKL
jgi:uncharacterized protein (DUF2141 family)